MEKIIKINKIIVMLIAVCFRYFALYYNSAILNYGLIFVLFLLVLFNILNKKFESKQFQRITILILISAIIFFINNEDNLFIYVVASLALVDESYDKIIKYFLIFSILSFVITIISGQLGIIDTVVAGRYIDYETVYRNSLGFGNVNTPFIYFLGIVFGLYYFFRKKPFKLFLIYIVTTLIALWMFKETDCRTGMYIYGLFVIVSLLYSKKLNDKLKPIFPYLFIIFTVFSIVLALGFGNTIHNFINETLSNRPYFSNYYLKNNLFLSLFGTGVVGSYVLDNFYLSLMVKSGLISYVIYLYIFVRGTKGLVNDYRFVLIIVFTLLYGILECNLYGNFIFIILLISTIKKGSELLYED